MNQIIPEKIRQRRAQMLVHSYIYYKLDDSIVSDHKWQQWAFELAELQNKYPQHCNIGFYDDTFKGWTGGHGGSHLPLSDYWVQQKGRYILELSRRNKETMDNNLSFYS